MEVYSSIHSQPCLHANEPDTNSFSAFMHTLIKVCFESNVGSSTNLSVLEVEEENRIEQFLKRNIPFSIQIFKFAYAPWTLSSVKREVLQTEWSFQKVRHKNCSGLYPNEVLETLRPIGELRELVYPDQVSNSVSVRFTTPGESDFLNFASSPSIAKHHIQFPYNFCVELTISCENNVEIDKSLTVQKSLIPEVSSTVPSENFLCRSPKFSLPIDLNFSGYRNEDFESPLSPLSPDYSVHSVDIPYNFRSLTFSEPISLKRKDTPSSFHSENFAKRLRLHAEQDQVPTPTPNRARSLSLPFPGSPIPTARNKFNFQRSLSLTDPNKTHCLLGSFEESIINGRLQPLGMLNGFKIELAASGSFCPKHSTLDLSTAFFTSSTKESGPSQYFGQAELSGLGKRGYHIPKKGTIQVTLFNPNGTVIKIFFIRFDMSDMPVRTQTFLRERTVAIDKFGNSYLQYLIHLSFVCTKSNKLYLHNNIRLTFTPSGTDLETKITSEIEQPNNPKYSLISQQDKISSK